MLVEERADGDVEELNRRIRGERDAEQRDRYRVVVLAIEGRETKEIQLQTYRSRGFVQRWVYAYRDFGIEGLMVRPRGGSDPKLPPEQQKRFVERFKAGPTEQDGGICRLGGRDGIRILQQEFGVTYTLTAVYELLRRNGLSCLRPRPRHRKSDPQAQQQWLERAPFLSRKSARSTRTNKSKSGSRMKHDSDSKER
jgi:transposase